MEDLEVHEWQLARSKEDKCAKQLRTERQNVMNDLKC